MLIEELRATPPAAKRVTAFADGRRIAAGSREEVALAVFNGLRSNPHLCARVFDDEDGESVDLNLSGGVTAIRRRYGTTRTAEEAADAAPVSTRRARGRPKLGVVAREVTLLPRHWDWLARQPGGASVALRRLVEQARKHNVESDRRRGARDATYRVMVAMAGDARGFEEAARALFAGDAQAFGERIEPWPVDLRAYLMQHAAVAFSSAEPA